LINCIACTEFVADGVAGGGAGDRPPPNWDEESRFVAAALPQGLAPRGLYLCFVDDVDETAATAEQRRLELLRGFLERNAQALRPIFAPCGGVVVAVKALRATVEDKEEEGQEEDARRPVFYRLRLDQAAVALEKVASVEEAKAGQALLRDFGLFRTRLSVPLHAASVDSLQEQVDAIEAQINGEGVHFLFPSGDKGGALVTKTTNASFPAKEFQQSKAPKGAKGEVAQDNAALAAVEVKLYTSRSGGAAAGKASAKVDAPVLTFTPAVGGESSATQPIRYDLELDALACVPLSQTTKVSQVLSSLIAGLTTQLRQASAFIRQLSSSATSTTFNKMRAYHFCPLDLPHVVTLIYPVGQYGWEDYLGAFRQQLHRKLLLPLDRPLLKSTNSLLLEPVAPPAEGASLHLRDVHRNLGPSGVGGRVHLVDGSYEYYHYLQDKFDDRGWGCAYRSMQTICSWIRIQGYTQLNVPTHREIQRMLVDMKDKPASFVGSREWIGAIEIQMCLDKLYGLSCKILRVSSGAELAYKGAELARHFDTQGTPVMIGGGVLAYTLLGVDFNEDTGAIKFLILDPHYTGVDVVKAITKDKWCGWKDASLFRKDSFYNLCMPQRPREI